VNSASRTAASQSPDARWLVENGPGELELLFRAIVYHPSAPVLITDDDGNSKDASIGAGKLLGLSREQIIGRPVDDFADPACKPQMSELWHALQQDGGHEGTLRLVGPDASQRDVAYTAKVNVMPVRNLLVLRDKTADAESKLAPAGPSPSWVQDYALYLLDMEGRIAAWYSGAARIYCYQADEAVDQHVSFLYPGEDSLPAKVQGELKRAAIEGHVGAESWHARKDGSRFWANAITMALKDEKGQLRGFARVVRDFTDRHERDDKLRRSRARIRPIPLHSTIVGVVSGEFDRIPEVNDAFLALVGYSREDLAAGRLNWPDLTPPECVPLDEVAHEEGLRFGACTPFEKELIRKDGSRVPVLVATAVLKLSPFRWITFVQDLRERERAESIDEEDVEPKHEFEEIVGTSEVSRSFRS
jgi:PAS domain S-box-containing protein